MNETIELQNFFILTFVSYFYFYSLLLFYGRKRRLTFCNRSCRIHYNCHRWYLIEILLKLALLILFSLVRYSRCNNIIKTNNSNIMNMILVNHIEYIYKSNSWINISCFFFFLHSIWSLICSWILYKINPESLLDSIRTLHRLCLHTTSGIVAVVYWGDPVQDVIISCIQRICRGARVQVKFKFRYNGWCN